MAADPDTAAILAGIKERQALASDASLGFSRMEERHAALIKVGYEDAPALLGAVEAVLALHRPDHHKVRMCDLCQFGEWPCPTYRAISAALTGTESTDA